GTTEFIWVTGGTCVGTNAINFSNGFRNTFAGINPNNVTTFFQSAIGVQTAALTGPLYVLTDAATVTPNLAFGINQSWTIGATGRTLANPANLTNDLIGNHVRIYIIQDSTGNRTITTWGSSYKFSGGSKPTLSTAANAVDEIDCFVRTITAVDCIF